MFNKEKCKKCKKKISENYSFCPYCGTNLDENQVDWGMLGKNDFESFAKEMKLPLGFNTIFNSLMKNLSKEFETQMRDVQPQKKTNEIKKDGISISISTFGNGAPKIKVSEMGKKQTTKKENPKFQQNFFTKEKAQEFIESPKVEPKTNIRRLSSKVIYELEMPDVSGMEDVSIIKLENSIEIKAIGKKKSYSKVIPINLPITSYDLSEGKLILELGVKG
jgi:RNA polymerase subunit RPABC4/transcription elongation factor Spt4